MPDSRFVLSPRGTNEIVGTRMFPASRETMFAALVEPATLFRWMWGSDEWRLTECVSQTHEGGQIRFVWSHADGRAMGLRGLYTVFSPPVRMVHTELFDEDWTGGETKITTDLAEHGPWTQMVMTIEYTSQPVRDRILKSNMGAGMELSYARLEALLRQGPAPL